MLDLPRLILEGSAITCCRVFRLAHHFNNHRFRRRRALANDCLVILVSLFRIKALPTVISKLMIENSTVSAHYLAKFQSFFSPPRNVSLIAEGTHHQNSGPFFGIGFSTWKNRNLGEESGGNSVLTKQSFEPLIIRVSCNTYTRSE